MLESRQGGISSPQPAGVKRKASHLLDEGHVNGVEGDRGARPLADLLARPSALPEEHPARLIPALCRQFYTLGWVTGTGGGISIREGSVLLCDQ